MVRKSVEDRFWSKVDIKGEDECWNWTPSKNNGEYGRFWIGGSYIKAHRLSYEITFNIIPRGLCVCHKCDNPSCVNPKHLFLGTVGDNNRDIRNKGRYSDRNGVGNGNHKLTTDDVRVIKHMLTNGASLRKIARVVGVSTWPIKNIADGKGYIKC